MTFVQFLCTKKPYFITTKQRGWAIFPIFAHTICITRIGIYILWGDLSISKELDGPDQLFPIICNEHYQKKLKRSKIFSQINLYHLQPKYFFDNIDYGSIIMGAEDQALFVILTKWISTKNCCTIFEYY